MFNSNLLCNLNIFNRAHHMSSFTIFNTTKITNVELRKILIALQFLVFINYNNVHSYLQYVIRCRCYFSPRASSVSSICFLYQSLLCWQLISELWSLSYPFLFELILYPMVVKVLSLYYSIIAVTRNKRLILAAKIEVI